MDRRDFIKLPGLGLGSLMLPINGRVIAAEACRDVFERVGEVAIVVQRVDQHRERRRILGRQTHAGERRTQMVG